MKHHLTTLGIKASSNSDAIYNDIMDIAGALVYKGNNSDTHLEDTASLLFQEIETKPG